MSLSPNVKKILLPRFDTLGDIILLEPFLRVLHEAFKPAEISILVSEGYDQLAPLFPKYINWQVSRIDPYRNLYLEQIEVKVVKDLLNQLEGEASFYQSLAKELDETYYEIGARTVFFCNEIREGNPFDGAAAIPDHESDEITCSDAPGPLDASRRNDCSTGLL